MSAVASVLSVVLFLAFATSGLQRVYFNPTMSESAGLLGFTRRAYQRIGGLEIAGAIGLLVGLDAKSSTVWWTLNVLSATGLSLLMTGAVAVHVRARDKTPTYAPALALGLGALLELILRASL
jgi:hypothetical protein